MKASSSSFMRTKPSVAGWEPRSRAVSSSTLSHQLTSDACAPRRLERCHISIGIGIPTSTLRPCLAASSRKAACVRRVQSAAGLTTPRWIAKTRDSIEYTRTELNPYEAMACRSARPAPRPPVIAVPEPQRAPHERCGASAGASQKTSPKLPTYLASPESKSSVGPALPISDGE